MVPIHAYVGFNGKCREAMAFYQECFGGELNIMIVGETPMADQMPPGAKDTVMHASLIGSNFALFGSDMAGPDFQVGNNITLSIAPTSEEDLRSLFAKLSEGGNVDMPITPMFWGALFTHFVDKFGVTWMLNYELPKAA